MKCEQLVIRALEAGLSSLAGKDAAAAEPVRREFTSRLADGPTNAPPIDSTRAAENELRRLAIEAARHAALAMRASHEIGDDAFHQIEEELDWLEMASRRTIE